MFVLNKKTGNVQECHNNDAIKACRKDTETYAVAERKEDLMAGGVQKARKTSKKEKADKNPAETEKTAPEAAEDGNGDGGQQESEEENLEDETTGLDEEKLTEMDLQALRETAKELGIAGYTNMNKDTLIAMILNH